MRPSDQCPTARSVLDTRAFAKYRMHGAHFSLYEFIIGLHIIHLTTAITITIHPLKTILREKNLRHKNSALPFLQIFFFKNYRKVLLNKTALIARIQEVKKNL